MRYSCIIPDGNPAFTVDISDTKTVHQLKSAIKDWVAPDLNTIAPAALKLYQINIDASDTDEYIKEVQRLAKNLDSLTTLSEPAILRSVFPSYDPLDGRIHILVDGKMYMLGCGVVLCAVAETCQQTQLPRQAFRYFTKPNIRLPNYVKVFGGKKTKLKISRTEYPSSSTAHS